MGDQLMVFDARESVAKAEESGDYPPFDFIGLDGEDYQLPHPMWLDTGVLRRVNEAMINGDDKALAELFAMMSPEAAAAIDDMPLVATTELVQAWQLLGMPEEGKSSGPRSTPNRAARRSKPTSRPAASTSGTKKGGKQPAASGS